MKIESIWSELENDQSFHSGILFKRLSPTVLPNLYVALRAPEKLRCIAANVLSENIPDIQNWNKFKDIKVETYNENGSPNKSFLLIILLSRQYKDIFSILCTDLLRQVSTIIDEKTLIRELFNRLAKWQTLFEQLGQQGLTDELQRGLYGELYFLRKFIKNEQRRIYSINSWQALSNTVQDFHYGNWAVEVKTTHGNNHQKIHISSERQLDNFIVPNIFLLHLSLDIRNNFGESLNEIVDWHETFLRSDVFELGLFKLKLIEYGYFDFNRKLYEDIGYNVRQESIYKIDSNFPRITEKDIRKGVGDVKYSIVIADCTSFLKSESELFKTITELNVNS